MILTEEMRFSLVNEGIESISSLAPAGKVDNKIVLATIVAEQVKATKRWPMPDEGGAK